MSDPFIMVPFFFFFYPLLFFFSSITFFLMTENYLRILPRTVEGMNFPKISKLALRVCGNYADHFSTRAHTRAHQLQFDVIQWLPAEIPRATLRFLDGFSLSER